MATQKKTSGGLVKNIVMFLFIIGAGGFVWMRMQRNALIKQENEAVKTLNDGEYEAALEQFLKLHDSAKGEALKRHKTQVAKCYVGLADKDGLTPKEQLAFYEKAAEYDKKEVPELISRILESRRQQPKAGAGAAAPPEETETENPE